MDGCINMLYSPSLSLSVCLYISLRTCSALSGMQYSTSCLCVYITMWGETLHDTCAHICLNPINAGVQKFAVPIVHRYRSYNILPDEVGGGTGDTNELQKIWVRTEMSGRFLRKTNITAQSCSGKIKEAGGCYKGKGWTERLLETESWVHTE